jgi:hypothetical protein
MSRHVLPAEDGLEVVVGWDPPLNTYFAQAWDRRLDEEDPAAELLWIGCTPREIRDPQQVCDAVSVWAPIPAGLAATLYADAESTTAPNATEVDHA